VGLKPVDRYSLPPAANVEGKEFETGLHYGDRPLYRGERGDTLPFFLIYTNLDEWRAGERDAVISTKGHLGVRTGCAGYMSAKNAAGGDSGVSRNWSGIHQTTKYQLC
jgi:hypothetical protein